jgi:hypothetical protein
MSAAGSLELSLGLLWLTRALDAVTRLDSQQRLDSGFPLSPKPLPAQPVFIGAPEATKRRATMGKELVYFRDSRLCGVIVSQRPDRTSPAAETVHLALQD